MIKHLRWKFVVIMMTVVALLLTGICVLLFVNLRNNLRKDSLSVLQRVIAQSEDEIILWESGEGDFWGLNPFGKQEQEVSLPYFTVAVNRKGQAAVIDCQFYDLNDQKALLQVVRQGMEAKADSGVLPGYRLRYLRKTEGSGWRIAFTDMTQEISTIRSLLRNLLLIGGAALVGFFFLSLLLARWATRPAERAWKQQRQFVADASHELKTPLTVVLSNVDMIQSYAPGTDDRQRRWLGNIQSSSEQMKELVEEMLTLARSDNGGSQNVVRQRVNFSDLVAESILRFEPAIYECGKRLEEQVAEELYVMGDAGKLRRLIDVLLDNARKYTSEGGQIGVTLEGEGRSRVRLTVRSQGTPIPEGELEQIFERFYRADPSRTEEGFGLGLPIAREIAREHRGKLWAESSTEKGNVFRFSLPRAKENGYK